MISLQLTYTPLFAHLHALAYFFLAALEHDFAPGLRAHDADALAFADGADGGHVLSCS